MFHVEGIRWKLKVTDRFWGAISYSSSPSVIPFGHYLVSLSELSIAWGKRGLTITGQNINSCSWGARKTLLFWRRELLYIIVQANNLTWCKKEYNSRKVTAPLPDLCESRRNFCHVLCKIYTTPKEQCSRMLSLSRTIFKGPKVTWKNIPHKVNCSKNLLKYLQWFFFSIMNLEWIFQMFTEIWNQAECYS